MRIGVVTTSYPRFDGDAAGSFVAAHVAYLRGRGHDVDVVAAGAPVPFADGLFYEGGAPDAIEAGASLTAMARFTIDQTRAVMRRARGWDATVAHWWVPSGLAAAIARAPKPIVIAHGGDIHVARRAKMIVPVALALVARRARFVFVSRALRAAAIDAMPRALAARIDRASIVQPMGIDVAHFASLKRAPIAGRIAVFARLVPIKGVAIAIEAMRHVRGELIIAGDGPLRASLERDAPPNVRFAGALDARARDELLRTAAIVVVPSIEIDGRTEGTPMIAMEALAAGVPVVASATGGLVDLPGVTRVPPGDPRTLAAAIDRELVRPSTSLGANGRAFDWATVGAAIDAHWMR
ncbi:MAG TPA: glycosyltransferase family 4 protein [Kofleriaceae bacterium]|nr:glycosyltransferase family 4 protein [Kofleriaceae bacterium]